MTEVTSDTCARCGNFMPPVSPDKTPQRRATDKPTIQRLNALGLRLFGGYGMFFDDVSEFVFGHPGLPILVICHDCAHWLVEQNPWLAKGMDNRGGKTDPAKGHGHQGDEHRHE